MTERDHASRERSDPDVRLWLWLYLRGRLPLQRRQLRLRVWMRVEGNRSLGPVAADGAERDPRSPEVLRVLLDNHARFLAFLERRVGSRDEAEDILQEAFVRSLDHAGSLQNPASATAWFYRVLRNAITDHFRRQASQGRAIDRLAAESEMSDSPDPELEAVVCACVLSLLDTLKPEYGSAIRRVDLEGVSVRGFADEAGITPGNAGVRLHRAREALRRQLVRCCGTCLTHGCLDCSCNNQSGTDVPPA